MINGTELVKELLDGARCKNGIKVTDDETTMDGEGRRLMLLHSLIHNI